MTDAQTRGGFAGDPAAALTVTGTGCCATSSVTRPDAAQPCCGAGAEATGPASCCGAPAKAEAVAAGADCCG
ncbi:hypothetical protein AB0K00_54835 [Dactylosporangium sp. NPDC049525]|uniref:hypothetical protein n=1 Tax=Dactylosporangium sp. NPDC049525 TaxID=3154730 RepID=UPI003440E6BF